MVKSRGHFRAGFQHLCPPERIIEVDVPGLSCQNLERFEWRDLPRPCWPLDCEAASSRALRWDLLEGGQPDTDDKNGPLFIL